MTIDEFIKSMGRRGKPAKKTELASLEQTLGIALPGEYRSFLEKSDGGWCGGSVCFGGSDGVCVQHIFGLSESKTGISLPLILEWMRDGNGPPFPKGLLPIMDDPGGNAICLGLRGEEAGKVYFWHHESGRKRRLLAKSFNEFVKGLEPAEDDEGC